MQTVGQRIVVLGISGSGKSTLARKLCLIYGFNYIELDNLFWKPNWVQSRDDEFAEKVRNALAQTDCWVVDGNYMRAVGSSIIWKQADTLIWLDYPLRINLWRIWKRTWARFLKRESLWESGNKENLWKHFFTRDSLFVYALKSYSRKKRQYDELFASHEYANHHLIHLTSPKATELWLQAVKNGTD